MVATTKVKAYLKQQGIRASKDLPEALNVELQKLLDSAIQTALRDRRRTVQPKDLAVDTVRSKDATAQ